MIIDKEVEMGVRFLQEFVLALDAAFEPREHIYPKGRYYEPIDTVTFDIYEWQRNNIMRGFCMSGELPIVIGNYKLERLGISEYRATKI